MQEQLALVLALILVVASSVGAQDAAVAPPENIVAAGVPAIPAALAETAGRYKDNRAAFAPSWHPQRRELLISTRFANTYQTHVVKMPGGARQQLTFFPEPVYGASYHPKDGNYLLFQKDVGGGEWFQYFRYDVESGES